MLQGILLPALSILQVDDYSLLLFSCLQHNLSFPPEKPLQGLQLSWHPCFNQRAFLPLALFCFNYLLLCQDSLKKWGLYEDLIAWERNVIKRNIHSHLKKLIFWGCSAGTVKILLRIFNCLCYQMQTGCFSIQNKHDNGIKTLYQYTMVTTTFKNMKTCRRQALGIANKWDLHT